MEREDNYVVKSQPLFSPSRVLRDGFHVSTVSAVCPYLRVY